MKVYIAGKVSKNSHFGKHHWRDEFCAELQQLSGIALTNLDPLKVQTAATEYPDVFVNDVRLINQADVVIVYLSDDISVGGSQEILIARYLKKPVIGFAPLGGKFNGSKKEMLGEIIENYQDPFVFSTCDIVCGTIEQVARSLPGAEHIKSTGFDLIDQAITS